MMVIGLTAFIGLVLVSLFVAMFMLCATNDTGREALLPLAEETPHLESGAPVERTTSSTPTTPIAKL